MRYLVDIFLAGVMLLLITMSEGWWQLLSIMPFLILVMRIPPKNPMVRNLGPLPDKKPRLVMNYIVTDSNGEEVEVECTCMVQYNGKWVHFTNEITEFGYHPHVSFYRAQQIRLVQGADITETLN